MMELKVRPVGNSLGVVLPDVLLERLNLKDGDTLYLTEAPDGSMRVRPHDKNFETQVSASREAMAAYRNTLRELAK